MTKAMDAKEKLLGTGARSSRRKWLLGSVVTLAVAACGWYWWQSAQPKAPNYETVELKKGSIQVTVTANGKLKPVRTVSIGSELSGIVARVLVDVNSQVKAGQVLIELDTAKLQSAVNQARASLSSAKANLAEREASVVEARAKLNRFEELNRTSGGRLPSRAELDEQRATVLKAEASVLAARAAIEDAQATLATKETDLQKASIKSPVDGVVLARSVEPGYAVAASLQAVELLTVATDLRQLELEVDVDEADVGQVKPGQPSTFTVASYPNRHFKANLTKVAYGAAASTDNVVTYTTYLSVENPNLALRPGMTATATIETARKDDILLVPNTALRFAPKVQAASSGPAINPMMMRRLHAGSSKTAKEVGQGQVQRRQTLYVLRDGKAQKLRVTTGLTDGRMTELISDEVKQGDRIITQQLKSNI